MPNSPFIWIYVRGDVDVRRIAMAFALPSPSPPRPLLWSKSSLFDGLSYNDHLRLIERDESTSLNSSDLQQYPVHRKGRRRPLSEAEGGFDRSSLLLWMMASNICIPSPSQNSSSSRGEVADGFPLRSQGIPVPKVFGYSARSDSASGNPEYIFMELVTGNNLGDIWFQLSEGEG